MSGPDLRIETAVARATNAVDLVLTQAARAVDSVDVRDGLCPGMWALSGPGGSYVANVVPTRPAGQPDRASFLRLVLALPMSPGGAYTVAPAPSLLAAEGQPIDTTPAAFTAPLLAPVAGFVAGRPAADVALPPAPSTGGGPALLDPLEALLQRLEIRAYARKRAFRHMLDFGNEFEPKRQYGTDALSREAASMSADLRRDPDVLRGSVSIGRPVNGALEISFDVVPRFTGERVRHTVNVVFAGTEP